MSQDRGLLITLSTQVRHRDNNYLCFILDFNNNPSLCKYNYLLPSFRVVCVCVCLWVYNICRWKSLYLYTSRSSVYGTTILPSSCQGVWERKETRGGKVGRRGGGEGEREGEGERRERWRGR